MNGYEQHFSWPSVQLHHFYIYLVAAAVLAFILTLRSKSEYKFEGFLFSFYFLSGNLNDLLTIKIPGFSFFEIQSDRLLYLVLLFLIVRKGIASKANLRVIGEKLPVFFIPLFVYILLIITSLLFHMSDDIGEGLKTIIETLAFLIFIWSLAIMKDRETYSLIGRSIIIAAVVSCIVSLVQFTYDDYFLRIGDNRPAFGTFIRANGIFSTEYYHSYFLIMAISWVLISLKSDLNKLLLVGFLTLGVIVSFQRMSWIILFLVLLVYLIYVEKVAYERLLLTATSILAVLLTVSIFYYQEIMNSSMVKERLGDSVGGRKGYYSMVIDNIHKKPWLGYGNLNNEVYYKNLLLITQSRDRATGKEGDLHSGYFSSLFLYGIPALVFYILFVVLAVVYYFDIYQRNIFFIIPLLLSMIYAIGNLTNTFIFLKYISILYAVHIGMGLGINSIINGKYNGD